MPRTRALGIGLGSTLVAIVLLKFVILYGAWFAFLKPHAQRIDAAAMAGHLLSQTPTSYAKGNRNGA